MEARAGSPPRGRQSEAQLLSELSWAVISRLIAEPDRRRWPQSGKMAARPHRGNSAAEPTLSTRHAILNY